MEFTYIWGLPGSSQELEPPENKDIAGCLGTLLSSSAEQEVWVPAGPASLQEGDHHP